MYRHLGFTAIALVVTVTALSAQSSGRQRSQGPPADSATTMDHGQMQHGQDPSSGGGSGQMQHGQSDGGGMEDHGGSGDGGMMGGGMMEHMRMMHGGGEGGGTGGGMAGGMGGDRAGTDVGGPGPARILGMVEALDLSADQIGRLGTIREELVTVRTEHQEAMERAREAARQALGSTPPDFGAYEEALREESDHRVRMQVAAARAGSEARAVLDPAQLERLQSESRGGMGGGMGGGTTEGGGTSHSH